jgi:hypothetical protein
MLLVGIGLHACFSPCALQTAGCACHTPQPVRSTSEAIDPFPEAVMADGAALVAVQPAAAIVAAAPAEPAGGRKRRRAGAIDIDTNISKAKESMKEASKALARARADAKNEKRKKARLMKKASQLTMLDLGRIAQLKNAGLWDPAHGLPDVPGDAIRDAVAPVVPAAEVPSSAPATPSAASGPASSSSSNPGPSEDERSRIEGAEEGGSDRGAASDVDGEDHHPSE